MNRTRTNRMTDLGQATTDAIDAADQLSTLAYTRTTIKKTTKRMTRMTLHHDPLIKARQTSTPYLSANQRAQSFCRNSAPAISGLEDDHPPPSAKGKGKGKNHPSTASTSTPLSSRSTSTPTANNKRQRTMEDSVMTICDIPSQYQEEPPAKKHKKSRRDHD